MERYELEVLIRKADGFGLGFTYFSEGKEDGPVTGMIYEKIFSDIEASDDEIIKLLSSGYNYHSDNHRRVDAINSILDYWELPALEKTPDDLQVFESYKDAIAAFDKTQEFFVFKLKTHSVGKPNRPKRKFQPCGVVTCIHNANEMCMIDECDMHIRMFRQEG